MKKFFVITMLLKLSILHGSQQEIEQSAQLARNSSTRIFFEACQKGDLPIVEKYIESKEIDIHAKCERGFTAACRAAMFGKEDVFKLLVGQGVRSEFTEIISNISDKDDLEVFHPVDFTRDFFEACQKGDLAIVKNYVESKKIDIHAQCKELGITGSCRAALWGHKKVFEYLSSQGVISEFKVVCELTKDNSEFIL